jgi:MEDS: MEthanogen/methylotroph, DcmR Sensory domain
MATDNSWKKADADLFWGDIAFHDHILQVYDTEEVFLETLAGYVGTGILIGDCCVAVFTKAHLASLNERLRKQGIDVDDAIKDGRYIGIIAEEILPKFVVAGVFNELLFNLAMSPIFDKCQECKCPIRAGGEMVALLAAEGNWSAVLQLEQAWNKLHEQHHMTIYCAYPKSAFVNGNMPNGAKICSEHGSMVSGSAIQSKHVHYREDVNI